MSNPIIFLKNQILVATLLFLLGGTVFAQQATLRSFETQDEITVSYFEYTPDKPSTSRGVIIMPPTGGISFLERAYAKKLCRRGARVLLVDRWSGIDHIGIELSIHQKGFERAMTVLKDLIEVFPEGTPISLFGASLGGLTASVGVGQFSQVDTAMVVATGGPFSEVIANSQQKDLAQLRKLRKQKFGFSTGESYLKALQSSLTLDPWSATEDLSGKKLGMVILGKDISVPAVNQEKLFELWQPQFVRRLDKHHIRGILATRYLYIDDIVDFLLSEDSQ